MARPLRIEYGGAFYHVMARGNQGQKIFADDADRQRFLETLGEACQKTGWWVHAYVLMGNHYHLLVETPEGNLVAGMKWLQSTYTQRFNRRHKVFGHLFQGRYKAVVVDGKDPYYLQFVSTYIHLNPARAGMIRIGKELLKSYRWSSYPWYLAAKGPEWLKREVVMGSLRLKPGDRRAYEKYLEGSVLALSAQAGREELEAKWKRLRRGWYLGTETFLEKLEDWLERAVRGRRRESQAGAAREFHDEAAAEKWLRAGMRKLGVNDEKLKVMGYGTGEKVVLAWWLRRRTTVSLRWVSERLVMGHSSRVSQAVSRANRKPARQLRPLMQQLETLDKP